jgi:hypothetical protein
MGVGKPAPSGGEDLSHWEAQGGLDPSSSHTGRVAGVRFKSGCETLFLNSEGHGGVASSALLYYQIRRPTKLNFASFNQLIGAVGSRIIFLITIY